MQGYFSAPTFPDNMPAIWEERFAFLRDYKGGTPVVMGEFGGFYTGKDKQWQDTAMTFMRNRGIGLFYFALNPGEWVQTLHPMISMVYSNGCDAVKLVVHAIAQAQKTLAAC